MILYSFLIWALMILFFQLDWAGACWGRWAGPERLLGDLQDLDVVLPCKKNKNEEGPMGASPVAAPMPKLVTR